MIYLDNAATTPIDSEVLEAMLPYMTTKFGNPGTLYSAGREARAAVDEARVNVADFLNCEPSQVIFTSGGSEGNSLVIGGLLKHLALRQKRGVITSLGEHESVIQAAMQAAKGMPDGDGIKPRFDVSFLPIRNGGVISMSDLRDKISESEDKAGLVSVMYVNNELGTVNPVKDVASVCHGHDVLFHTDCVQAAGTLPLNVQDIECDFLTISSHKIYGPKGVGAIFAKHLEYLSPIVCGSDSQEFGVRGGTENVAGIVGFGRACDIMKRRLRSIEIATSTVKQNFFSSLMSNLASHGAEHIVHVNGEPVLHNGKILNIRFDGVDAETLILMLDASGVCVSAGSACHGHESTPSRVLLCAGLTVSEARSSVRISFSKNNTTEEAEDAARIIAESVLALRN